MSFEVHPEKIDTYHNLIGQGIWAQAISRMGDAKNAINANLDRLTQLSNGSATELARSATMYRHTDRKHAEQLDNTY